ncbi:MAG TPA: anthranilate synthase component I, partial [Bacteroidetes bacterium]|nr:anthranilate synthase component I [Bacteroidota bacterium]
YDGAEKALSALASCISSTEASLDTLQPSSIDDITFDSPFSKSSFVEAVGSIKEHIHEGDAFQVVLSRALTTTFSEESLRLYRALRHVNPSPYMFYIDHPEICTLVGSSPEILVQVKDQTAVLYPIAGT